MNYNPWASYGLVLILIRSLEAHSGVYWMCLSSKEGVSGTRDDADQSKIERGREKLRE